MTEREYVETLLSRAETYIAWVGQDTSLPDSDIDRTIHLWDQAKQKLSPHTMRDLCQTWLNQADDEHTAADQQVLIKELRERTERLEKAITEMIYSVPGGSTCDPQRVCDTLRSIAERHGAALAEKGE